MMIRSAPPASAHLADRPVPAPAPMITPPPSIVARSRARASSPVMRRLAAYPSSLSAIASANAVVVDVAVQLDHLDASRQPSRSASNSAASASGSWNGWPSASISETPPSGTKSAVGPVAADSLRAIRRPSSAHSSARRAHQRHRRVVHVEVAVRELRRDGVARAEVDHVERAERDDLRDARAARRLQPVRAGREHAADQVVAQLGGRRRRARRRGSRPRPAPPSRGRRCRWRGRRAPRSRAPRAPRARASRTAW